MSLAGECRHFVARAESKLEGLEPYINWISAIDFAEWPQQHRLQDGKIRPAMVTDLGWHDFGAVVDGIVPPIMAHKLFRGRAVAYQPMLSVVMPGHSIPSHLDVQIPEWITRVHIPLMTNPDAKLIIDNTEHHLELGYDYLVDVREEHAVVNRGETPRIHFMFDVRRA